MASTEMIQISQADYQALLASKSDYEKLQKDYDSVRFELDQLKRMIFGSKSERFKPAMDPQQLALFDIPSEEIEPQKEQITYTRNKPTEDKKQPVRSELPAHLPRVEHVIEIEDLPEGAKKIGEETSEYLEYESPKLFVVKIIRPKYVVASDDESTTIAIAPKPELPLPKSNAGAGLLTQLMISKYVDHLPFYRQVQMFKRLGVELSESTISGWFRGTSELLEPLYRELIKQLLDTDYLMADETPIPVLTKDKPGSTHKGYHWVYNNPIRKMAAFDYQTSRGREGPRTFLKDYSGYLQTDGYTGYNNLSNPNITLMACMAHARRKFDQAKGNDPARAEHALGLFQELYAIERTARDAQMDNEQTRLLRKEVAQPKLKEIKAWLDEEILLVAPASAIGKAMAYTLNLWPRLIRYLEQGRFHIDNNMIENIIRPVALGRKNYLFAGSHDAAQNAAIFYSFMATCKLNDVNPEEWLRNTLSVIRTYPVEKLYELLPNFVQNL
ncbi:MAG: IS66 family transposase [Desulfocapsaceae bacterium]|nr:IS66 family transposase [Desulfocapsaceae bacterium]